MYHASNSLSWCVNNEYCSPPNGDLYCMYSWSRYSVQVTFHCYVVCGSCLHESEFLQYNYIYAYIYIYIVHTRCMITYYVVVVFVAQSRLWLQFLYCNLVGLLCALPTERQKLPRRKRLNALLSWKSLCTDKPTERLEAFVLTDSWLPLFRENLWTSISRDFKDGQAKVSKKAKSYERVGDKLCDLFILSWKVCTFPTNNNVILFYFEGEIQCTSTVLGISSVCFLYFDAWKVGKFFSVSKVVNVHTRYIKMFLA